MPVICEPDKGAARRLAAQFREYGKAVTDLDGLIRALAADPAEVVAVIGPGIDLDAALAFAEARRLDRPALGVILVRTELAVGLLADAMRAGIREVVPDRDFPALMEACRRSWEISTRLRAAEAPPRPAQVRQGRVVVTFAAKGGCGKSVVSMNLAVALAMGGRRRVCLVDLDLAFGDVGIMLRAEPQRTIVDAVPMLEHMDETGVQSMLVHHDSGLAAVLAPVTPGDAERVSGALVTELLTVLRRMFDVVIVDTSSQFSEHVLAALDTADLQLLLATPEVTALKGLRVTLDMLDLLRYPPERSAVVLNRADARAGLSAADIDRVIGRPIAAHIPSSQDVPASVNSGIPLAMDRPHHPVTKAIHGLAGVALRGPTAADSPARARGRRGRRAKAGKP